MNNNNINIIRKIKLIIIENNGCLSNPVTSITHKGDILQTFNIQDILAITDVPKDYQICIISNNNIHIHYLNQLKIKENNNIFFASNIDNKLNWIEKYIDKNNIRFSEVAYIGFSINDLQLLDKCGLSACPSNAHYKIKDISKFVSSFNGGDGAVYEFLDLFNYNGKESIKNKLNEQKDYNNYSISELLSEIEHQKEVIIELGEELYKLKNTSFQNNKKWFGMSS